MKKLLLIMFIALFPGIAHAERLVAVISLSKQTMDVTLDEELIYHWNISSGKIGYETPPGYYNAQRKYEMWRSRTYDNAPMPYAVFFYQGYAVHGTEAVKRLGSAASHGCIRLNTYNAKKFYDLVGQVGMNETLIEVRK